MTKRRNNSMDALRIIAAFFVVGAHVTDCLGSYLMAAIGRPAVLVFLMISGFFFFGASEKSRMKSIKKLFVLAVVSNAVYFLYCLLKAVLSHATADFFAESFSPQSLINFLVFGDSPFGGHLWYLSTCLYAMVIMHFMLKLKPSMKILLAAAFVLIALDLVPGTYGYALFGIKIPSVYLRNFVFVGIPYLILGGALRAVKLEKSRRFACPHTHIRISPHTHTHIYIYYNCTDCGYCRVLRRRKISV